MPSDAAALAVVIPVRNDAARLARCLASIAANPVPRGTVEVIVVDNASTDRTAAVAAGAGARVVTSAATSVAALRNAGAALATAPLVAFVDADHEIDPGWIAAALGLFEDPAIGGAGAHYRAPADGTWVQRTYDSLRGRTVGRRDVEWLGSGNLVVRRRVFEHLHGFDTALVACEDVDLCGRLRRLGHRLVADERLRTVHLGDPETLRRLFVAELWRGRNNLRVSLRGPLSLGALPSIVVPVVDLGCLAAALAGLAWATPLTLAAALASGGTITGLALLRAARMTRRADPDQPTAFGRALAVAIVYDLARAVALVARAPHRARASGRA